MGLGKRAKVTTKQIRKARRKQPTLGVKPSVYIETTIPSLLTAWPSRDVEIAAQQMQRGNGGKPAGRFRLFVSPEVLSEASHEMRKHTPCGWRLLPTCQYWRSMMRLKR